MFAAVLWRLCKVTTGQQIRFPSLSPPIESCVSSTLTVVFWKYILYISPVVCHHFFYIRERERLYHFAIFGIILSTAEQHKQSQKKTNTAGTCNLSDKWNTWFSGYISGGVAGTFLSKRQPSISSFTLLKMDPRCLVVIWCVSKKKTKTWLLHFTTKFLWMFIFFEVLILLSLTRLIVPRAKHMYIHDD